MSELTAERLAELREMHKQATPGTLAKGLTVDYRDVAVIGRGEEEMVVAYFPKKAQGHRDLYIALRNSASELFDLAQEALAKREMVEIPRKYLKLSSSRLPLCCGHQLNGRENFCPQCGKGIQWKD